MLNRGDHINMFVCTVKSVYEGHISQCTPGHLENLTAFLLFGSHFILSTCNFNGLMHTLCTFYAEY